MTNTLAPPSAKVMAATPPLAPEPTTMASQTLSTAWLELLIKTQCQKKDPPMEDLKFNQIWWRGGDLNSRPSGYEPDELPDCSTPR